MPTSDPVPAPAIPNNSGSNTRVEVSLEAAPALNEVGVVNEEGNPLEATSSLVDNENVSLIES